MYLDLLTMGKLKEVYEMKKTKRNDCLEVCLIMMTTMMMVLMKVRKMIFTTKIPVHTILKTLFVKMLWHNNPQPNVVFAEPDLRSGSLLPRYPT